MNNDQLAEIRARCDAATPGPWAFDEFGNYIYQQIDLHPIAEVRGYGYLTGKGHGGLGLLDDEALAVQSANANFIAHARKDIPALLSEISNLTSERDAAIKDARDNAHNSCRICAHYQAKKHCEFNDCAGFWRWRWRGLTEEAEVRAERTCQALLYEVNAGGVNGGIANIQAWNCSECDEQVSPDNNFCPGCGAKIIREEEDT